jgi:hypothetical protein
MAHYDAVIVRVWRSKSPAGWQWSGQLEHVPSGEVLRFSDPMLMLTYLREAFCGDETAETTAEWIPSVGGLDATDSLEDTS